MPNIHVKNDHKVNLKDPKTLPDQKLAEAKGRQYWPALKQKLEKEGTLKQYLKENEAHPANVLGLPNFYTGHPLQTSMSGIKGSRECPNDGGCAIYSDGYICPRCGEYVESKEN